MCESVVWMGGSVGGSMDGWIDGWKDARVHGSIVLLRMDACMHGCTYHAGMGAFSFSCYGSNPGR